MLYPEAASGHGLLQNGWHMQLQLPVLKGSHSNATRARSLFLQTATTFAAR